MDRDNHDRSEDSRHRKTSCTLMSTAKLPAERRRDGRGLARNTCLTMPNGVHSWRTMGGRAACALRHRRQRAGGPRGLEIERAGPRRLANGSMAPSAASFAGVSWSVVETGLGWRMAPPVSPSIFQSFTVDALDAHRPLCRRSPPSRRGSRQRAHASSAMADQALRLGRSRRRNWGATGLKLVGGRLLPGPHRTGVLPDV